MSTEKMTLDDYIYSKEIYNGYQLTSQYLTMHDGVRIAIDIYRPTLDGVLHTEKLPVVWTATQYLRAKVLPDPPYRTMVDKDNTFFAADDFDRLIYHGYIVAVIDVRGSGASFGKRSQNLTLEDMNDFRDINEWLASQPWSAGRTGMFGTSFLGRVQYATAAMAAPSLKCIVPMVCEMEYPTMNMNGMMNTGWMRYLDSGNKANTVVNMPAPVDEDTDGTLCAEANEEHKLTVASTEERSKAAFMDSYVPGFNGRIYMSTYFPNYLNNINNSGVAVYIWGGLKDLQTFGSFKWWMSLKTPKKMLVGNWVHSGQFLPEAPDYTLEHLRWYDYWLKGIDNGIMDEPPIMMQQTRVPSDDMELSWSRGLGHTVNNPFPCCSMAGEKEWKYYNQFPVEGSRYERWYLHGNKSGSIDSVNDGTLSAGLKHSRDNVRDEYVVDYSVSRVGIFDRNMFQVKDAKLDASEMDKKCLTYTTPPLSHDVELVGIPVMNLFADASVEDIDFYMYLEEVNPDGVSFQLSEARIRASFRDCMEPPFEFGGLPWHRYYEDDQHPLIPGVPAQFKVAMTPLSSMVAKGNRLRVTICNNDKENWDTKEISPAPIVHVYREIEHPSYISLPVVK